MVKEYCEFCEDGLAFGYECLHCGENWKDRFFKDMKKNNFNKKHVINMLREIEADSLEEAQEIADNETSPKEDR